MQMIDIEKIKSVLRKNPVLRKNLELLVEYCIKNQTLTIDKSIDDFESELLQKEEVLKLSSKKYSIENNSLFAYQFYKKNIDLLNLEFNRDFQTVTKALLEIENKFNSGGILHGFSRLKSDLWAIAILEFNKAYSFDFVEYLDSLNYENNRIEIYSFNEGFGIALPKLKIKVESFYKNVQQLENWINSRDAYINLPLSALLKGIRNKVHEDEEFGLDCFKFFLKQEKVETTIFIPIITGLYEKLGMDFFKQNIEPIIENEIYSVAIICGLSNIKTIKNNEASLFLLLYKRFNKENIEVLINIPKLLFSILKSDTIRSNSRFKKICFKQLDGLVIFESQPLIHFILHEITFIKKYNQEKTDLIKKLIEQPHFIIESYIESIDEVIWNLKDLNCFNQIITHIATYCSFQAISRNLTLSLHGLLNSKRIDFDKLIIELIISNKAIFRFIGIDIFNELSHKSYKFEFDILTLDSLSQYKLWVSICQNYREPKYVIPCLLPLLKSKSGIVKEALICKMEEYTENYGGSVIEVLSINLDLEDSQLKQIYERIEKYMDDFFSSNVKVKANIKELNPYYSQNRIFLEFNKSHTRRFSNQIQKSTSKNSVLLSLIPTVKLLKGGGWKMEGKEDISKLGKVSSSFSLPRNCFIEAENFDFEQNMELSTDWDHNYFDEIEKFLSNE